QRRLHRAGRHVIGLRNRDLGDRDGGEDQAEMDRRFDPFAAPRGHGHPPVQPVPPTVMRSIRSVGWPTPTGTPWPFLPQVPMPVSSARSLPIMVIRWRSVGPLPINIAPFKGAPTLPFSIL